MKIRVLVLAVALFALPALALASPANQVGIPVVANVQGIQGSVWKSDLWISNPSRDRSIEVVVVLSGSEEIGHRKYVLAPGELRELKDVLQNELDWHGVGSLLLYVADPPGGRVEARARTWTTNACGTVGQWEEGVPISGEVFCNRLPIRQEEGFRTNIGLSNFSPLWGPTMTYAVSVFDGATGSLVARKLVEMNETGHLQVPLATLAPGVRDGWIEVSREAPYPSYARWWIVSYASMVSNESSDGEFWVSSCGQVGAE